MSYCIECGAKAHMQIPVGDSKERLTCPECNYIHYVNPNVICGALVVHEGKVLLCRRAIEPRLGFWTIPAGFMEIGESVAEGAGRETFEEACASINKPHLYCMYDLPEIGHINMFYLSDLDVSKGLESSFAAGEESLECALFSEEEIPWDDISFLTVEKTLKHYFADRKKIHNHSDFPLHQEVLYKPKYV